MLKLFCSITLALGLMLIVAPNAGSTTSPTARIQASAKTPQVVAHGARGLTTRRPRGLSWCDNSDYVTHIKWRKWRQWRAIGRGLHKKTCVPFCAAGNYEVFRVRIRLHRVRR